MVKAVMCWKCHKYIADGEPFCRYCGAAIASPNAKFKTDGRTVDTSDETAYLHASPPKYKRRHGVMPILIIGILIVGMMGALAVFNTSVDPNQTDQPLPDGGGTTYGYTYNYGYLTEPDPDLPGYTLVQMTYGIKNINAIQISSDNFSFKLRAGSEYLTPLKMDCISRSPASYGDYLYYNLTFRVPNESIDDTEIICYSVLRMVGNHDSSVWV